MTTCCKKIGRSQRPRYGKNADTLTLSPKRTYVAIVVLPGPRHEGAPKAAQDPISSSVDNFLRKSLWDLTGTGSSSDLYAHYWQPVLPCTQYNGTLLIEDSQSLVGSTLSLFRVCSGSRKVSCTPRMSRFSSCIASLCANFG